MINFFKKKKANIHSMTIPNLGWEKVENTPQIQMFVSPEEPALISKDFFDLEPDLPTIKDIDFLRTFYRRSVSASKGGIICVDLITIKGFEAVKTIFKYPMEPSGMAYVGGITIPFKKCSFVIRAQAREGGMTGMRDAVMLSKCMESGEIHMDDDGKMHNWFVDPYDAEITEGLLMNKSEDEKYDAEFPDHPLSRVRELLSLMEKEVEFGAILQKIDRFDK